MRGLPRISRVREPGPRRMAGYDTVSPRIGARAARERAARHWVVEVCHNGLPSPHKLLWAMRSLNAASLRNVATAVISLCNGQ